jgi:hypothetical protein
MLPHTLMSWDVLFFILGVLSPWVGLITVVIVQGHTSERLTALEQEVSVLHDQMGGLTKDLGWKQE